MSFKLPNGFNLVEQYKNSAIVTYSGRDPLQGKDGALQRLMDATGYAKATVTPGTDQIFLNLTR